MLFCVFFQNLGENGAAGDPGSPGPKGVKGAKGAMGKWMYINDDRNCTRVKGHSIGFHSFSTYAKFSETLTFLIP